MPPPRSVHIWSTAGEPFSGKWRIKESNGTYLNFDITNRLFSAAYFRFHYNLEYRQIQLVHADYSHGLLLSVDNEASAVLVDEEPIHKDAFSLINTSHDQWGVLKSDDTLSWTHIYEDRSIFYRMDKLAEHEGQVGTLSRGEVALYEHKAYHGKVWIFSDSAHGTSGIYNFSTGQSFARKISSIRLGSDTFVTISGVVMVGDIIFSPPKQDFIHNVPNLEGTEVGDDNVGFLKIYRTLAPETIFESVSHKLSQDYRLGNNALIDGEHDEDELVEFTAYRTILKLTTNTDRVTISATDATTIEVNGTTYNVSEGSSVTVSPNVINQIMITSVAKGIKTPGLKFHTADMAPNERVILFPDQGVHTDIAQWNNADAERLANATFIDENGNEKRVIKEQYTEDHVKTIVSTLSKAMQTVSYTEENTAGNVRTINRNGKSGIRTYNRALNPTAITKPWSLRFTQNTAARKGGGQSGSVSLIEEELNQQQFLEKLVQADHEGITRKRGWDDFFEDVGEFFEDVGEFFEDAGEFIEDVISMTFGVFEDVFRVFLEFGEKTIEFVLDTYDKVIEFVQVFIENVVEFIGGFIEFVRFVFEWDDILQTRNRIAAVVEDQFDAVDDMIDTAQSFVSDFTSDLKDDVETGINALIAKLDDETVLARATVNTGQALSNDEEDQLPEEGQWFLNLVIDSLSGRRFANQNDLDEVANEVMDMFTELVNDMGGVAEDIIIKLINAIKDDLSNQEKMLINVLEAIRDVVINLLDIGNDVAISLLESVKMGINLLKEWLTAEIHFPLISHLLSNLGIQTDATTSLLDIVGLLVAIPVTITSKVIFEIAPFSDGAYNDGLAATDAKVKVRDFGNMGIMARYIDGLINIGLDAFPESMDDEGVATGFLELISLFLSGLSWLSDFPASPAEPGGYPYHLLASENHVDKNSHEEYYWERVKWGWRTAILGLDILLTIVTPSKQRMRRDNIFTAGAFTAFSLVDLGLTSRYLVTISDEEKSGRVVAKEVLGLLPDIACLLRHDPNPVTMPFTIGTLVALQSVATASDFAVSLLMLVDELDELD